MIPKWHFSGERALSLARTSGNPRTAARFLGDMGWLSQHWGKYDRAQEEFEEAHQIFRSLEDQEGICSAVHFLSVVARKRGQFEKAEKFCQEGLRIADELNSDHLSAKVKHEYAKLMRDMNQLDKAWEHFNDVKNWSESLVEGTPKDENITAGVWGHLAAVAIKRGEYQLAYDLCLKSLPFFEQKGTKSFVATLKHTMALAEAAMGRKKDALKNAREALYWYKRLGMAPDVAIVESFVAKLGGIK
ncbi:tetratricopeptide repeat protein [bacterium]|nr:tetratricopeptide repeat protein [bacterium]